MIAIQTRYVGPTSKIGARIKVWRMDEPKSAVSTRYPHELSGEAVHRFALAAFLTTMVGAPQDAVRWIAGATDTGYVFVYSAEPR